MSDTTLLDRPLSSRTELRLREISRADPQGETSEQSSATGETRTASPSISPETGGEIVALNPPRTGARVLVVGATGAFGSRLAESLVRTTGLDLIVAGRRYDPLDELAQRLRKLRPGATVTPISMDRTTVSADEIAALDPLVVVDAAGPFQGDDLAFAREVISAGRHYVDLADARDFIANFPQLDEEAKAAGVVAIAGASTTPALSVSALKLISSGWPTVTRVEIDIAPGMRGPRGTSVVKAILSYAGRPVPVLIDGAWNARPGWGMTVRRLIPGVGRRWLSLCETPDLDIIPEKWTDASTVLFRASGGPGVMHLGLAAMSYMVRSRILGSLKPVARPLAALADWAGRYGSDVGGMVVRAEGLDQRGARTIAEWTLIARNGDGPHIPTLPALSIIRSMAEVSPGERDAGAMIASQIFDLSLFAEEASRFAITTSVRRSSPDAETLFERLMGPACRLLPAVVRQAHSPSPETMMEGQVEVVDADNALGRLVASLFGFPAARAAAPALVTISRNLDGEIWTRRFGDAEFSSRLTATAQPGVAVERFGPLSFDLRIKPEPNGFSMEVLGWSLLGLRLPSRLAPRTTANGYAGEDGAYRFDVEITHPWLGRLVGYRGRLDQVRRKAQDRADAAE